MTGLEAVAQAIAEDMERRLPKQRKTQRQKLAILTAALLSERTVNLMDLGHALPIPSPNPGTRYQWIKRTLANDRIVPAEVMAPYARQILENLSTNGRQPILMIDQSQATKLHRHEMLMVAVRVGGRALPLAWCVRKTAGAIGFSEQRRLLDTVAAWVPDGVRPVLMGDRFYGSPDLIAWCAEAGWDWRLHFFQWSFNFNRARRAAADRRDSDRKARRHPCGDDSRARTPRAVDDCDVAAADLSSRPRLRSAMGHRGDVLRYQDARLQPRDQPVAPRRPDRALDPESRPRALLGRLDRHVGRR